MDESQDYALLTTQQAKQLLKLARFVEQSGFSMNAGTKLPAIPDAPRGHLAYVTTEITARSGTTAGKGKAALRSIPGVAGTATTIENFPSGGAAEVDVYNVTEAVVAIDKYIYVVREYASGKWVIVLESC